jgi:FeS assembly protein IscX
MVSPNLLWTDSLDIALYLIEQHPDVDPLTLHFTELRQWVLEFERFNDDP